MSSDAAPAPTRPCRPSSSVRTSIRCLGSDPIWGLTPDFAIELRDLSPDKLTRLAERIRLRGAEIARDTKTSIEFTSSSYNAPASAAVEVQQAIERSAGRLGLASQRMPSGAGHDAQMMARLSPMGMISVPSVGGISHSPLELTRWDDCARGADVLLGAVLEMDRA